MNLFDILCRLNEEQNEEGESCQLHVQHSRNLTLCLLTVSSLRLLGIRKARAGKTKWSHAQHEVVNCGLSAPGPDDVITAGSSGESRSAKIPWHTYLCEIVFFKVSKKIANYLQLIPNTRMWFLVIFFKFAHFHVEKIPVFQCFC